MLKGSKAFHPRHKYCRPCDRWVTLAAHMWKSKSCSREGLQHILTDLGDGDNSKEGDFSKHFLCLQHNCLARGLWQPFVEVPCRDEKRNPDVFLTPLFSFLKEGTHKFASTSSQR